MVNNIHENGPAQKLATPIVYIILKLWAKWMSSLDVIMKMVNVINWKSMLMYTIL